MLKHKSDFKAYSTRGLVDFFSKTASSLLHGHYSSHNTCSPVHPFFLQRYISPVIFVWVSIQAEDVKFGSNSSTSVPAII